MLDYLSGKTKESPRKEFIYVNDDGQIVAMPLRRLEGGVPGEPRQAFEVWREPFTELRVPLLFNLRRDPFERASTTRTPTTTGSSTACSWLVEKPMQAGGASAAKFLLTMTGLSAQPDAARLVQPGEGPMHALKTIELLAAVLLIHRAEPLAAPDDPVAAEIRASA
jgi:hypothetical protein